MIAYLSHALGGDDGDYESLSLRCDNIARAGRWFQFLVETTSWTICWPWYPYITYLDWHWQDRCRRDQRRVIQISNVLVLTGLELTEGMLDDRDEAYLMRVPVLDLTDVGRVCGGEPPTSAMPLDAARHVMRSRCAELGLRP